MVRQQQPLTIEGKLITIDVNPFTQAFREVNKKQEGYNPRLMGMRSAQLDLILTAVPSIDPKTRDLIESLKSKRDKVLSGYTPEDRLLYESGYFDAFRQVVRQVFQ